MTAAKQLCIQHSASHCQQKDKLVLWDIDVSSTAQGRLKMNHIPNSSIPTYIDLQEQQNEKQIQQTLAWWPRRCFLRSDCSRELIHSGNWVAMESTCSRDNPGTMPSPWPFGCRLLYLCWKFIHIFCICAESSYTSSVSVLKVHTHLILGVSLSHFGFNAGLIPKDASDF